MLGTGISLVRKRYQVFIGNIVITFLDAFSPFWKPALHTGNRDLMFADDLKRMRKQAIKRAREMPVANEDNQQRRM